MPLLLVQLSSLSTPDLVLRSPVQAVYPQTFHLSFAVCLTILDDLPPLVAVALPSSYLDLLRIFNYIVRVIKVMAYLLRREVHVDFFGSNVDDRFDGAEKRSS